MATFDIGGWRADTRLRQLTRGADVRRVSVKAMQVLSALADSPGQVLTRAELLDAAWPGVTVGEEVLTHAIAELRKSLGDDPRAPKFIQTAHKSGYRLLCAVTRPAPGAVVPGNARAAPEMLPVANSHCRAPSDEIVLPAASSGEATVVVLPFVATAEDPLRAEPELAIFETLNAKLTAWRWFKVLGADRWHAYKDVAGDPIAVARALDVRYLVTGSVRTGDGHRRLAVQLVDGMSGYQLWAKVFDRPIDQGGAIEDRLASKLVATIELELQKAEAARAIRKSGNQLDVYDLVQRGYWHYSGRTSGNNARALALFGEAIARDPFCARALTGQAGCLFWAGQSGWAEDPQESLRAGLERSRSALALDEQYPAAQLFLAQCLLFLGEHEAALTAARRALHLNPSYAGAWAFLGHALTFLGRFRGAVLAMRRAFYLTPNDARRPIWLSNLALAHFHLGNSASAMREAREAVVLQPGHCLANQVLLMTLAQAGRDQEAREMLSRVRKLEPEVNLPAYASRLPYRDPAHLSAVVAGLRKAHWSD